MNDLISNKTIAIIGSAGELDVNDYSKIIKDVDIVVRVNVKTKDDTIFLSDKIKKHTTSRTDIIYHSGLVKNEKWQGLTKQVISNDNAIMSKQNLKTFNENGIKCVIIIPHRYNKCEKLFKEYVKNISLNILELHKNRLSNRPCKTTGLQAIYDILQYNPSKLYIFGFDCYKGKKKYY